MIDEGFVMAQKDTAKLSAKFQISIPKAIRTARRWQAGQVSPSFPRAMVRPSCLSRRWMSLPALFVGRGQRITAIGLIAIDAGVDTSAWIEFLTGSALGQSLVSELPDRTQWLVPTMVQLELAKWLTREASENEADRVIAFTETCVIADLDTATALLAADLFARYKLSTADAIVYATALARGADLLTCDRHFETFPDVRLFPKSGR